MIHIKSIKIESKTIESIYFSDESTTRCTYDLRKDTIDKQSSLLQRESLLPLKLTNRILSISIFDT